MRSIHARKCISGSFSFVIGPPKSICGSSLGSERLINGLHFYAGIIGLRFLPISVHRLQFAASHIRDFDKNLNAASYKILNISIIFTC